MAVMRQLYVLKDTAPYNPLFSLPTNHVSPVFASPDGGYSGVVEDRFLDMQDKMQRAELTANQRLSDLQMLRSQFNFLVSLVTNNITTNNR